MSICVYFFAHRNLPLVKIGKSNRWKSRLKEIAGGSDVDLKNSFIKEVGSEREAFDLEYIPHTVFQDKRNPLPCGGDGYTEWFDVSVMDSIKSIVRNLTSLSKHASDVVYNKGVSRKRKKGVSRKRKDAGIAHLEWINENIEHLHAETGEYWSRMKEVILYFDVEWLIKYQFLKKENKCKAEKLELDAAYSLIV